jgi:protein-tyrosine sulfotransferase
MVMQRLVHEARRLRSLLSCTRSYLGGGYPLRHPSSDQVGPFFIVGSGRSGTTLLRAILTGHPALDIPPESYVLPSVIRGFQGFSFLPWDFLVPWVMAKYETHPEFDTWHTDLAEASIAALHLEPAHRTLRAILDEVYGAYTLRVGKGRCRWGDKTPLNTLHLSTIYAAFPDAQYVHLLRDGRAVAASYVCAGLYSSAVEAAIRWESSVQAARKLGRRLPARQFMEIRYEDLVIMPRDTIARVAEFLGVKMVDAMLKPWERAGSLGDAPQHEHHRGIFEPITAKKIDQWKESLSPEQLAQIEAAVGQTLKNAGYEGVPG